MKISNKLKYEDERDVEYFSGFRMRHDSWPAGMNDFSDYSDEELLEQFKSENWNSMSASDRIHLLQQMENRNAALQGREPAYIAPEWRPEYYGAYNDQSNVIFVDVESYSSYEALDTYIHESNHALQYHCIETGEKYDAHTLTMMRAECARDDHGILYNYATKSPAYDMQCSELDSNNVAAAFLASHADLYGDDPEYRKYIEQRNSHFTEVNEAMQSSPTYRKGLQRDQIYQAYCRGDISEQDAASAFENLKDGNGIDDNTAQQSFQVGQRIEALNTVYEHDENITEQNDLSSENGDHTLDTEIPSEKTSPLMQADSSGAEIENGEISAESSEDEYTDLAYDNSSEYSNESNSEYSGEISATAEQDIDEADLNQGNTVSEYAGYAARDAEESYADLDDAESMASNSPEYEEETSNEYTDLDDDESMASNSTEYEEETSDEYADLDDDESMASNSPEYEEETSDEYADLDDDESMASNSTEYEEETSNEYADLDEMPEMESAGTEMSEENDYSDIVSESETVGDQSYSGGESMGSSDSYSADTSSAGSSGGGYSSGSSGGSSYDSGTEM